MSLRRFAVLIVLLVFSAPLAACHMVAHVPPGQAKKAFASPPGHGGVPPGQMKSKQRY